MKIGIVVCNNGYGHIRRQSIIAAELIYRRHNVVMYAPIHSLKNMGSDLVNYCRDFNTHTCASDWMQGNSSKWLKSIGSMCEYDAVISDNLIDILSVRPDAIISGSFFWHKTLDLPMHVIENQEKLLTEHEPTIISNKYFSPDYIRSRKNFVPIGFIEKGIVARRYKQRHKNKSVLLTIGMGRSDSETLMKHYIIDVVEGRSFNFRQFDKIYIESRMFNNSLPPNFVRAKFDEPMFEDLDVVIGRPGMGIITECATRNIDYISILESSNSEMTFNNNVLTHHFNTVVVGDFEEGLDFACSGQFKETLLSKANTAGLSEFVSIVEGKHEFVAQS